MRAYQRRPMRAEAAAWLLERHNLLPTDVRTIGNGGTEIYTHRGVTTLHIDWTKCPGGLPA